MRRHGGQSVLRSARIARRVGLAPSDLECLDLLFLDGPLTPGEIMAGTGLTSSSVTAMTARLERRGLVKRERDPNDGRRVQVSIDENAIAPIAAEFGEASRRWIELDEHFTDDELKVVARYLQSALDMLRSLNAEVRSEQRP